MRMPPHLLAIAGCLLALGFVLSRHAPTNMGALSTGADQASLLPLPGELLSNAGFEIVAANGAADWSRDLDKTREKGAAERDISEKRSGAASMRLTPNDRNGGAQPLALTQTINRPGLAHRKLRYTGYLRVSPGAVAHIGLLTVADRRPGNLAMLNQNPTDGWEQLTGTYDVPAGSNVTVYFVIWVDGHSGAAWFDDLSLQVDGGQPEASLPQAPQQPTAAHIEIDTHTIIRRVPDSLYGANLEWIWNGNGLWLPEQNKPDPAMVSLTHRMGVKLLRYPGGVYSDFYHWKDGVGPGAARPERQHLPGTNERSKPLFGTDEALRFAREVGAELLITVNAGSGTAQEAAEWVRHVNTPKQQVRYWEIGNELYLDDKNLGPSAVTLTPQQYAARVVEFSRAMKSVDPTIRILAIGGENHGRYKTNAYPDWDKVVLTQTQGDIDYLAVHNAYAPLLTTDEQDVRTVYRAMLAAPALMAANLDVVQKQIQQYAPARASRIGIAVTEWGPAFRFDFSTRYVDHGKTLGSALFAASALEVLLASPRVDIANFWQLNDYSVLGWIGTKNTSFPPRPEWIGSARAKAFGLFTRYLGPNLVRSTVTSSTFQSQPVGLTDAVANAPDLMTVASLSEDGKRLCVITVNRSLDHDVTTSFAISGFTPPPLADLHILNGTSIDAHTGTGIVAVPGLHIPAQATASPSSHSLHGSEADIWIKDSRVNAGATTMVTFPAHSVSALVMERREK